MDDSTGTASAGQILGTAAGLGVLALLARAVAGQAGVTVVLGVSLAVVLVLAHRQLTGRPLRRPAVLARGRRTPVEPVVVDAWRSERWIRDAVERGLRSLEDWRLEQREA